MKGQLEVLMNELVGLSSPYNLEALYQLFSQHQALFDQLDSSKEQSVFWPLKNIQQLLLGWYDLTKEAGLSVQRRDTLSSLQKDIEQHSEEDIKINSELPELQDFIKRTIETLLEQYNLYLKSKDPLIAQLSYKTVALEKKSFLRNYYYEFKAEQKRLEIAENQLKLTDLLIQRDTIILQLRQLGIQPPNNPHELEKLWTRSDRSQRVLEEKEQKLISIHKELSKHISIDELAKKLNDKTQTVESLQNKLSEIESNIVSYVLEHDVVIRLTELYNQAINKAELIKIEEDKAKWAHYNYKALLQRVFNNTQFNKEAQQSQDELNYLKLLYARDQTCEEIRQLQEAIKNNQDLLVISIQTEPTDHSIEQIYERIKTLLVEIDSKFKTITSNNLQLVEDVAAYLESLTKDIIQGNSILLLLGQLKEADKKILEIKTRHCAMFGEILTELTEDKAIIALRNSEKERKKTLAELAEGIHLYVECASSINKAEQLTEQLKKNRESLLNLNQAFNKIETQLQPYLNKNYDMEINNIKEDICSQLSALIQLLKENVDVNKKCKQSAFAKSDIQFQEGLESWNKKIKNLLLILPPTLKTWYHELFVALQSQANQQNYHQRAYQLLEDILFELQAPDSDLKFPVLQTYKQICPQPIDHWPRLIYLKPELPPIEERLPPPSNEKIWLRLQKLYCQQKKLEKKHPKEALLLYQATRHLHQMALSTEAQPDQTFKFINPLEDPRYACLQRHRGFLRIGEWLSELYACIVKKTTKSEYNYQNFFLFTPTRSWHLMQMAKEDFETVYSKPLI